MNLIKKSVDILKKILFAQDIPSSTLVRNKEKYIQKRKSKARCALALKQALVLWMLKIPVKYLDIIIKKVLELESQRIGLQKY